MKSRSCSYAPATLFLIAVLASSAWPQSQPIDTQRSTILIHVFKSGVFSSFGDNHEVQAPISQGTIDETKREVTLRIEAKRLKVLDPKLLDDKRAEVQTRMLGPDVLDVEQYPEIQFHSVKVQDTHPDEFRVEGNLSLHGQVQPVSLRVTKKNALYQGECTLRQTAFGMKPIRIAGGTVKVKDELKIEFTIVPASR